MKAQFFENSSDARIESRLVAYLVSIIRFSKIDYSRKEQKYNSRYLFLLDKSENSDFSIYISSMQVTFETPKECLGEFESDKMNYIFIKKLTKKQRLVIFLSIIQGYSNKEISIILSTSQQSVSKMKRIALLKLRNQLRGEINDG